MGWHQIQRRLGVGSGQDGRTTMSARPMTAVSEAPAPEGGSGERGRCARIAGRMAGWGSDPAVQPTDEGGLIGRPLNQELEFRLDRIGADVHRAAGSAAAPADIALRLAMVAIWLNVLAWRATRQRERPIKRQRVRMSAGGETGEHGLDREQIGRESRDPAPLRRSVAMAHGIDLRFLDITVATPINWLCGRTGDRASLVRPTPLEIRARNVQGVRVTQERRCGEVSPRSLPVPNVREVPNGLPRDRARGEATSRGW